MRVGVGQRAFEPLAAENNNKTMSFPRLDDDLGIADFLHLGREQRAKLLANRGVNAARAAIGNDPFIVQRAKIRPCRDIPGFQLQAQPKSFDDAAPHLEFERIITEQCQVAGPAPGGDPRRHRHHAPLRRVLAQFVQVRRAGRFQRRQITLFASRQVAQSIHHYQRQLGVGFQSQFRIQCVQFHSSNLQVEFSSRKSLSSPTARVKNYAKTSLKQSI